MSTWLYLECLDHDPPLQSPDEVGQHLYDLPTIRAWLARDRDTLPDPLTLWNPTTGGADYFGAHTVAFLTDHPTCRIGIHDEYGQDYPIKEEDE